MSNTKSFKCKETQCYSTEEASDTTQSSTCDASIHSSSPDASIHSSSHTQESQTPQEIPTFQWKSDMNFQDIIR